MKKRCLLSIVLIISMLLPLISCGSSDKSGNESGSESAESTDTGTEESTEEDTVESLFSSDSGKDSSKSGTSGTVSAFSRPVLFELAVITADDEKVEASVPEYKVDSDLGNVINRDSIYLEPDWKRHLISDGFFVMDTGGAEFFETYENNRYMKTPNFVTVDSLMHSYHLYFAYLMKKTEKEKLCDELLQLTDIMLENSIKQKEEMGASDEWEKASDRNIAFFAVAKALLDTSYDPAKDGGIDPETLEMINSELDLVNKAEGIVYSPLWEDLQQYEDYTQYKPRGYYDTDEKLKAYFRAMMWYGRRNFAQNEEAMDRCALLMTAAMDDKAYDIWSGIYAVTSFFAGASDDNGVCEYQPLIEEAYGKKISEISAKDLSDKDGFNKFHELTGKLDPPKINSVPMDDDEGATDKTEVNAGFRFMGQRFSVDAAIFQKLIYSSVGENRQGEKRMLPDALDVPAALGSETAEKILRDDIKAMEYDGYSENLEKLRSEIKSAGNETWYTSLYAEWLNTLRPLLEKKGSGYPMFMQNENWLRKSLEGFLGSYTELKHDTVLYSKQVIAEMGGPDEDVDFRGYVEPEPVIYRRFSDMAQGTKDGLKKFDLLDDDASENLDKLKDIADRLHDISVKELKNETLTDDEFEFIEIYGGEIGHFWYEAYQDEAEDKDTMDTRQFPAPLVVDVATDPNGSVLELADGGVSTVFVVVPVEGQLRIAKGTVYNFYQFTMPIDKRMTDHEWRVMLGIDPDDSGEYHWEQTDLPDKPVWTESYRVTYD